MADSSMMDRERTPDGSYDPYSYGASDYYQEYQEKQPPPLSEYYPPHAQQCSMLRHQFAPQPAAPVLPNCISVVPRGENPREIRNKAEKKRRDKLNHSISELAAMVPPVLAAHKKIDKTGVLRLTAHYLRAHQYVFGDSIGRPGEEFSAASSQLLLSMLGGFLLTATYNGLVVVVSQNIQQYLGHIELDLLGQNIFNYIHPDDYGTLKKNLMPNTHLLGPNGKLHIPDEADGKKNIIAALAREKRHFFIRFKKYTQRSEPATYVPCYVEGTMRMADSAYRISSRCCQVVRRARTRGDNPYSSGNDVVFIGLVRPTADTFISEKRMEAFRMEYRTRHLVDGEIIECDQRISLVAGYMTHEVNGVNAMNFIHRDDVRWVIFSLREMYDQFRLKGESCYRLMAKSGQFIYMKTRGVLDVDQSTKAVRSFVCTNTMVDEQEGKHLIGMMKNRCNNVVQELNNVEEIIPESEAVKNETLPVQDLERVILHLVTNLPSPQPSDSWSNSPECAPSQPLTIIPPRKERILSAIEKFYSVIKAAGKREQPAVVLQKKNDDHHEAVRTLQRSPARSPVRWSHSEQNISDLQTTRTLEYLSVTNASVSLQMRNSEEHLAFASLQEVSSLSPSVTSLVPSGTSVMTALEESTVQTEKDFLQFLYTGNMNTDTNEFGYEATPLQPNQLSRKRGQTNELTNINKKKHNGIDEIASTSTQDATPPAKTLQATISDVDFLADFDLNTLDVEVQGLEELDPAILWKFRRSSQ